MNENIPTIKIGQVKRLGSRLIDAIPLDLTVEQAQFFINNPSLISSILGREFVNWRPLGLPSLEIDYWRKIYEYMGVRGDLDALQGPEKRHLWNVYVLKELRYTDLVKAYESLGVDFHFDEGIEDLSLVVNCRTSQSTSYKVSFERNEATDYKIVQNITPNSLTITLPEYLLLQFAYFWAQGKFLDQGLDGPFLCLGSKYGDYIPLVSSHWYNEGPVLHIGSYLPLSVTGATAYSRWMK